MNRKQNIIIAAFLLLITAVILLGGCSDNSTGDKVERFAQAAPAGDGNITVPGYEDLSFKAGDTSQSVNLQNPPTNACYFRFTLIVNDETLWTSDYIEPGEAVKRLTLSHALDKGGYDATLHYDCYTLNDKILLNGADIKLK